MAVKLHRSPPPASGTPSTPRVGPLPGAPAPEPDPSVPRTEPPKPSFPSAPSVRLTPPVPLRQGPPWDRIVAIAGAAAGGVMLLWALVAGVRAFFGHRTTLDGVVIEQTRTIPAPASGSVHQIAHEGVRLETGAAMAAIIPLAKGSIAGAPPDPKKLEASLKRAEAELARAIKHQADVEVFIKQERATKSEREDAARDVRFRTAERDRLTEALAAANGQPHGANALLADAPLTLKRFVAAEGATVAQGDPVAVVLPSGTWVEASLGKIRAPEEGAPAFARIEGVDVRGHITGIHVEGATRTVTVALDTRTPLPAGTKLHLKIGSN